MRYIVKNADKPLVIDADGINALCSNLDALKRHKNDIIMTPHMMEFSRLINVDIDKIKAERNIAQDKLAAVNKVIEENDINVISIECIKKIINA